MLYTDGTMTEKAKGLIANEIGVNGIKNAVAPTFDTSTAYTAGQYVWHDGKLYKFTTDHAAGSWNAAQVAAVAMVDEVSGLKGAVKGITGNEAIVFSDPSKKQYINTSGTTASWDTPSVSPSINFKWAVVECAEGDVFTINGHGGQTPRLWAFCNSSKTILEPRAEQRATGNNLVLVAPEDAAYLIINDDSDSNSYVGNLAINQIRDNTSKVDSLNALSGYLTFNKRNYYATPSVGSTANRTAVSSDLVDGLVVPCVTGQTFVLNGTPYNSSGIRPCAFTDANSKVVYKLDTTDALTNHVAIAPLDGYAIFNFSRSAAYSVYSSKADTTAIALEHRFTDIDNVQKEYGYIPFDRNCYITTPGRGATIDLTESDSLSVDCAKVACSEGQRFVLNGTPYSSTAPAPYCFVNSNNKVILRGETSAEMVNVVITSPCDGTAIFQFRNDSAHFAYTPDKDVSSVLDAGLEQTLEDITEDMPSTNLYDGDITSGKYINNSGTEGNSTTLCYMNKYIPVSENDKFIAGTGEDTLAQLRFVTAYDSSKNVLSDKGANGGYRYTTPAGVAYIRITFYLSDVNDSTFRLNRSAFLLPYEPNTATVVPKGYESLQTVLNSPLSALPDYIIKSLAYRPLGSLSKPYICLVSDDGDEDMVTYSIPMVEAKGVPCTWAIMSTSEIFTSENSAEDIAAVVDSVANHGCAISQHGGTNWTEYTEHDLNEFFEREKAFMASHGLVAKSAVIPSHFMSELVCAVAGGKYGICRCGFNGQDAQGNTFEDLVKPYPNYTCGARTNVYALTSQNLAGITQEQAQTVIDYVFSHNGIAIFYWHENSLTASLKQRIEDAIDYALGKGIDFITLDQIATII